MIYNARFVGPMLAAWFVCATWGCGSSAPFTRGFAAYDREAFASVTKVAVMPGGADAFVDARASTFDREHREKTKGFSNLALKQALADAVVHGFAKAAPGWSVMSYSEATKGLGDTFVDLACPWMYPVADLVAFVAESGVVFHAGNERAYVEGGVRTLLSDMPAEVAQRIHERLGADAIILFWLARPLCDEEPHELGTAYSLLATPYFALYSLPAGKLLATSDTPEIAKPGMWGPGPSQSVNTSTLETSWDGYTDNRLEGVDDPADDFFLGEIVRLITTGVFPGWMGAQQPDEMRWQHAPPALSEKPSTPKPPACPTGEVSLDELAKREKVTVVGSAGAVDELAFAAPDAGGPSGTVGAIRLAKGCTYVLASAFDRLYSSRDRERVAKEATTYFPAANAIEVIGLKNGRFAVVLPRSKAWKPSVLERGKVVSMEGTLVGIATSPVKLGEKLTLYLFIEPTAVRKVAKRTR